MHTENDENLSQNQVFLKKPHARESGHPKMPEKNGFPPARE